MSVVSWVHLSRFEPTEDKALDLVNKLVSNRLYLSDEHRTVDIASAVVLSHLVGDGMVFEIGEWQGLIGLVNVVPGWKADLLFKLWDKSIWGAELRRELEEALNYMIDEFKLERVFLETPDTHTSQLAIACGFEQEGLLKNHFKWDGVPYDVLCLGLNRRD